MDLTTDPAGDRGPQDLASPCGDDVRTAVIAGPSTNSLAKIGPIGRIFVGTSPGRGRGVFAGEPIQAGELIETCPVIVVPAPEIVLIDRTELYNYYFGWEGGRAAIALGFGSLYNHSHRPNAAYSKVYGGDVIRIRAIADIRCGEEIFIRYNTGNAGSPEPLWFDVR